MTSIQIPTPIVKSFLDRDTKAIVGQLTSNIRLVEIEVLGDADAPLAAFWSDEEFEHFVRRETTTGRFWRRTSDPLENLKLTIPRMWKDDLFGIYDLCCKLGGIHSDLNDEQEVALAPRWRLPQPSNRDKKLQDRDPSLSVQNEVIDSHMAGFRIVANEIYELVPEPVAIVRRSNQTPVVELIDVGFTFKDVVMIYSLRDSDLAQNLLNQLDLKEFDYPVEFALDTLDRSAFGPSDARYQHAAFLREFENSYTLHLLDKGRDVAGILASFDNDDRRWLNLCAESLLALDDGSLHAENLGTAVDDYLSGRIGAGLKTLTASWQQFQVVTNAVRQQLGAETGA